MKKLKTGFLGAGEMARIHAGVLRDIAEVEIVGVTSRHQSSALDLINSLGFEKAAAYTDFDQMLAEKRPMIFGDGKQTRDFIHVFDIVKANLMALKQGDNILINIGTEIIEMINYLLDD
mgnify:CR=1 FL=1